MTIIVIIKNSPFISKMVNFLFDFFSLCVLFGYMYIRSLFLFRQDLRLHDNTALIDAIKKSKEIFPIFIHDTRAREDFGIDDPRFGFIREVLEYLDNELTKYGGRLTVYQ